MDRLLNRNRIFLDRTKGIGVLTKEEAINRSCTGPIARASGVTRDLRKDEPYLAYPDFDFKVCLRHGGRLLRPLPGAHGGDAREPEDRRSRRSRTCRPGPVNVDIAERTALPDQAAGLLEHRGH